MMLSTKTISIDPNICFGKPRLASCGLVTWVVADRFVAGESVAAIADDYGIALRDVEAALRYELATPARKRKMTGEEK